MAKVGLPLSNISAFHQDLDLCGVQRVVDNKCLCPFCSGEEEREGRILQRRSTTLDTPNDAEIMLASEFNWL